MIKDLTGENQSVCRSGEVFVYILSSLDWKAYEVFMKRIVLLFLLALVGCVNSSYTTNISQLKQEILSSACDEELRRYLADRINKLGRTLNERQLIKNLNDIRDDINCE